MKKYLMSGALALIAGLFVTSCHDDDVYVNSDVVEQKMQNFEKVFKEVFGPINPNQTWGFKQANAETKAITSISASTRSANPNSNMWEGEGYVIPAAITDAEITKVKAVFDQKGKESYTSLVDWDCFFVQQVWKGTASYTAGNGGTVVGGNQMDWLCAGSPSMGDDHVNNFNNSSGSIMLMVNSSTQRFGYKSSTDNGHVFYYFRMEYIDGAYYVGFDFSAEGQNSNEQVQRDYIYNDWIVKIVPGKGYSGGNTEITPDPEDKTETEINGSTTTTTEYKYFNEDVLGETGRIFCEDLGSNYSSSNRQDLDYNDVVFNAQLITRTQYCAKTITTSTINYETVVDTILVSVEGNDSIFRFDEYEVVVDTTTTIEKDTTKVEGYPRYFAKIDLYAAGGTIPLSVAGIEVHEAFGVGVTTMVNTRDANTPTVNGANTVVREPITLRNPNPTTENEEWFEFDYPVDANDIPVFVLYSNEVITLQSEEGKAPHKIKVSIDTQWASERCYLGDAYPQFKEYVKDGVTDWESTGNQDYLYSPMTVISTEAVGYTNRTETNSESLTEHILYENAEGYDISRGLYFTNRDLLINKDIQIGDRLRFYATKPTGDWCIFLADGNSNRIHVDQTSLNNHDYAEVTLTADLVSKLRSNNNNAAMVISGYGTLLTKVSLIKK